MPPKTPRKASPSKGARTWAQPEAQDESSPAIPLDQTVLAQALTDLRNRIKSLATEQRELRRDPSDRASSAEGATAEEPRKAVRRLQFENSAPALQPTAVGVFRDSREPNWDFMLDKVHRHMNDPKLKERDRAELAR